jgi:ATP-dependent Clp protease ATP-binding subunit ClpA
MFERFTERARQVVVLAQDEARALKHNYIGTEHILLGLLREEEGIAARMLESFDVTLEEVRAQVGRIVGEGDEVTTGQIPFTPRAKKVLELSLKEALSLGHKYIGTEHVLLGVVRENEGVAARILLDFGADAESIRNEVIRALSGPGATAEKRRGSKRMAAAREAEPELAAELDRVTGAKERAIDEQDFERAASLREQERRLTRRLLGRTDPSERARVSFAERTYREPGVAVAVPDRPGWRGIWLAAAATALAGAGLGLLVGWLIWG